MIADGLTAEAYLTDTAEAHLRGKVAGREEAASECEAVAAALRRDSVVAAHRGSGHARPVALSGEADLLEVMAAKIRQGSPDMSRKPRRRKQRPSE